MKAILLGSLLVILCATIQAQGSIIWLNFLYRHFEDVLGKSRSAFFFLSYSFLLMTILHVLQTMVWAIAYYFTPSISENFSTFSEAFYFSIVVFTTLGFGDITLGSEWRILSGIEAINGLMLIGWTTAMIFAIIQRMIKEKYGEIL